MQFLGQYRTIKNEIGVKLDKLAVLHGQSEAADSRDYVLFYLKPSSVSEKPPLKPLSHTELKKARDDEHGKEK